MAFVTDVHCKVCNLIKHEVTYNSGTCSDCRHIIAARKRNIHLRTLEEEYTLEERIKRIEEELYDLHIDSRLGTLEARTATY